MLKPIASLAAAAAFLSPALAAEKTYDVAAFTRISVGMGISAEIEIGPAPSARAEASEDTLSDLDIFVKKDELVIRRKKNLKFWENSGPATVYVTTPSLVALDVSTGAEATATGIVADEFDADISTGGQSRIEGSCGALSLDMSTGAEFEADAFECKTATVDGSTGANARIRVTDAVDADVSFGASVDVYGDPKTVNVDSSFGGEVDTHD